MTPGATVLMRTPAEAHSIASDLARLSTPARAAPLCDMRGKPLCVTIEMLTTEPPCSRIDCVKTSRHI